LALYQGQDGFFRLWQSGTLFSPVGLATGDQPYSMNDQTFIVGTLDPTLPENYDADGYLRGFFWDGQTKSTFADLLPPIYRQAFRGAIPVEVTNAGPDGKVRIRFAGESLEGPDPGEWSPGHFILERASNGETSVTYLQMTQPESVGVTEICGARASVGLEYLSSDLSSKTRTREVGLVVLDGLCEGEW
jgi:hypothetical protein